MGTHNLINQAQCYFWVFKEATLPAEIPGPHIFVVEGDTIAITVTNALDEPHAFSIPALEFTTGPIAPGETVSSSFVPNRAGTYLYYDNLNEPVNRVMGLHGALVVMPAQAPIGRKFSPYTNPPEKVQQLFDDLGTTPWWPGLSWEEGDISTGTPPFRQSVWVLHQASPNLFAAVGDYTPGLDYPASQFVEEFLHDTFHPQNANNIAQFFTISGQSGHFSHNNPYINPNFKVGEPVVIRMLNAGLWTHSMHFHANHFYILNVANAGQKAGSFFPQNSVEPRNINQTTAAPVVAETREKLVKRDTSTHSSGVADSIAAPSAERADAPPRTWSVGIISSLLLANRAAQNGNLLWVDVYTVGPMEVVDLLIPYMRPPDIPNERGIGRADAGLPTLTNGTTWPPTEELQVHLPAVGTEIAEDQFGNQIDLAVQLSPLAYPMHDHSEPSQTSQGGNYNMGMIAGMNFTGDRNTPGGVTSFPNQPLVTLPGPLGVFPPTVAPPWFHES